MIQHLWVLIYSLQRGDLLVLLARLADQSHPPWLRRTSSQLEIILSAQVMNSKCPMPKFHPQVLIAYRIVFLEFKICQRKSAPILWAKTRAISASLRTVCPFVINHTTSPILLARPLLTQRLTVSAYHALLRAEKRIQGALRTLVSDHISQIDQSEKW